MIRALVIFAWRDEFLQDIHFVCKFGINIEFFAGFNRLAGMKFEALLPS